MIGMKWALVVFPIKNDCAFTKQYVIDIQGNNINCGLIFRIFLYLSFNLLVEVSKLNIVLYYT